MFLLCAYILHPCFFFIPPWVCVKNLLFDYFEFSILFLLAGRISPLFFSFFRFIFWEQTFIERGYTEANLVVLRKRETSFLSFFLFHLFSCLSFVYMENFTGERKWWIYCPRGVCVCVFIFEGGKQEGQSFLCGWP